MFNNQMHFVPHQRSLPPLPTSAQNTSNSWQRSSFPVRSQSRFHEDSYWHKSSLESHNRQRSSSYLSSEETNKEFKNYLRDHGISSHSRSSSTFNLNERPSYNSSSYRHTNRYSTDDLTPLHFNNFKSLDRNYGHARSYHDVNRYDDYNSFDITTQRKTRSKSNIEDGGLHFGYDRDYSPRYREFDNYRSKPYKNISPELYEDDVFTESPLNYPRPKYERRSQHCLSESAIDYNSQRSTSPHNRPVSLRLASYHNSNRSSREFGELKSNWSSREQVQDNYRERTPIYSKRREPVTNYVYLKQPSPQNCTQVLATLVVSLGPLCAGLGKGYSSPALASMATLSAQGHHFSISKDEGSWVASLSLLGAFFGSFPAGFSIQWGRKRVLTCVAVPFALSWLLTVLASNVYMLYVAAIIGGVCTAVISVVTPVYISEIAHPEIRGCLCSFSKLSSNIGMLLSYMLGAFLNWRHLAVVTAIAPACLFVTSLFIPETPSYLLYCGRDAEAAEALKWLRGSTTDVSKELTTMKANIATLRRQQQVKNVPKQAPRELIRPLFITCGLMVFQKFSGANAFNFYAVPILSETFVGLNPYRAAVVVAFVQICAGMASSALVDTVGRRPLLVFSNMLMSASLAAFGGYIYLKGLDKNEDMFVRQEWKESDWVPLFCILVIEIAYAIGVSPISWLYIGEIFPLKHRGYGAIAAAVSYVCSFASVKTFVDFQNWLGLYGAFWFYSSIAAIALVFTLIFVPETKGKSLQEMQSHKQTKEVLI